jgi:nitrogen regulatory protein PII
MVESIDGKMIELMCVIVNSGYGSKVLKAARHHGVNGGTIFLGRGTVKSRLLEFLSLYDVRKEIVLMAAESSEAHNVLEKLNDEMRFDKPHHGIAFSTPITKIIGSRCINCEYTTERGASDMYSIIFTIVDKGKAEEVIEAAESAGSTGGTIINARGAGVHETSKLFSMEIEPEKEVVLILAQKDSVERIAETIKDRLKIEEPGNGIIFIQEVSRTYGLYHPDKG